MKKLMLVSLIIVFVLSGCGNQVKPVPTPTKEPVAQIEQPTVETEEPTEDATVVPTEEPTEVPTPTEEPTPVSLPDACPVEPLKVASPEELFLDFGKYGMDVIGSFGIPNDETLYASYLMYNGKSGLDENLNKIMQEGGKFSLKMPSAGIMYIPVHETVVSVNGETWKPFYGDIIISPEGGMIIPTKAEITVETEGGIEKEDLMLLISFLSGEQIKSQDIKLHEMASLSCSDEFWIVTMTNSSTEEVVIPLDLGFPMLLKEYDGLLAMSDTLGDLPLEYIENGMTIHTGDTITLEAGGYIELFIMDWYPYK